MYGANVDPHSQRGVGRVIARGKGRRYSVPVSTAGSTVTSAALGAPTGRVAPAEDLDIRGQPAGYHSLDTKIGVYWVEKVSCMAVRQVCTHAVCKHLVDMANIRRIVRAQSAGYDSPVFL